MTIKALIVSDCSGQETNTCGTLMTPVRLLKIVVCYYMGQIPFINLDAK
jgi:hypothetical protein